MAAILGSSRSVMAFEPGPFLGSGAAARRAEEGARAQVSGWVCSFLQAFFEPSASKGLGSGGETPVDRHCARALWALGVERRGGCGSGRALWTPRHAALSAATLDAGASRRRSLRTGPLQAGSAPGSARRVESGARGVAEMDSLRARWRRGGAGGKETGQRVPWLSPGLSAALPGEAPREGCAWRSLSARVAEHGQQDQRSSPPKETRNDAVTPSRGVISAQN